MKILLISPLPPPSGGIAMWTAQYLDFMLKAGHRVDLVNIAVSGKRVSNYTKKSFFGEILRTLKILTRLIWLLLFNRYDVVHFNTSCSAGGIMRDKLILDIAKLFRAKVILHCHCNVCYAGQRPKTKKLLGKMLKKAESCLVLNKISGDYIKEAFGANSILVPNFITKEYMKAVEKPKTINERIKTAVYVGHLLPTKGCDIIIDAANDFPDIEFRLVGHIGSVIGNMKRPENVVLTGELSHAEVEKEYENADVLLFPTHTEGFPLTVVEAMVYGLPVITTEVGAIPDILEDKGAEYIAVNDCEGLKAAIKTLDDSEMRKKMSEFNKAKVKSAYEIDKVLSELCGIYNSL